MNKTESAIRLTHIPTGVVVECQDGRSQHKKFRKGNFCFEIQVIPPELDRIENEKKESNEKPLLHLVTGLLK